jgi:protein-disulfide isomerase
MSDKKSNRQGRRAKQKRQEQLRAIKYIVVVGLILLIIFVAPNLVPETIVIPDTFHDYSMANGMTIGEEDAPILVEEYSDFQCLHCKTWFLEIEPLLLDSYVKSGVVRFEYHTAGDFLGTESRESGEAAYCANDQGLFWEMKETIFTNQPQGSNTGMYTADNLSTMAEGVGLDVAEFDACMSNNKYEDKVLSDRETFIKLGLSGTPSILVNGVVVENPTIQSIGAAIEAALAIGN